MQRTRTFVAAAVLCLAAVQSIDAQQWEPERRGWRHRNGIQVRVGRNYHLPADQIASWPIVVIGGSATIDGRIEDELVVIGGSVRVGPSAQIRSDIVSIGGDVQVAETAEVSGEIHDVGVMWPDVRFAMGDWLWGIDRGWWAAFMMAGTVFRFTAIMIAACILALVAPGWIRRVEARVTDAPFASGFAGVASQVLILPLVLVVVAGLVITIVGIPLLMVVPFALLAFLVTWLAGFASVAAQIGGRLRSRAGLADPGGVVVDVAWGTALLFLITFAGNLLAFGPSFLWPLATSFGIAGFAVEYLAWTVGLGAALLAPMHRRWGMSPPPMPSAAPASASA
jgi:hypothetical protein